jgi:hypothetical protein
MRLDVHLKPMDRTGGFDGKPKMLAKTYSWLAASHETFFSNTQQDDIR